MPYQIVIEVADNGNLSLRAPVPPPLVLRALREAADVVLAQVLTALQEAQLEAARRIVLAREVPKNGR